MAFSYRRFISFAHIDWRDFIREAAHTALAWFSLIAVVFWMAVCQEWSDMRWFKTQGHRGPMHKPDLHTPPTVHSRPLHDLVLSRLPYVHQNYGWISDLLVNSSALICVVVNLLTAHSWRARLVFLRRLGWMTALLYFMRSITISVTTMPPPVASCQPALASGARDMFSVALDMISGRTKECTDMVFSGHTVILTVSFLFWTRYACHWALVVYSAIHTVLGVASVLLVRYHYTLDVVLALFFTFFVHHIYYRSLETAIEQRLAAGRWGAFGDINSSARAGIVQVGGFAYSRVGPECGNCIGCRTAGMESTCEHFAHGRRSATGSNKSSSEIVEMAALTLTANTPEQEPRRTTSRDMFKALEAASVDESYSSSAAAHADDDDVKRRYDAMLMINRCSGNHLAAAVAWMDGLHLR
ncbi:hypothetical protein IW150_002619 [Coemansia sp. RSA 2607]|nr:hypothetical protein IW150_002619 [Coemansia sp. RSA 2607]